LNFSRRRSKSAVLELIGWQKSPFSGLEVLPGGVIIGSKSPDDFLWMITGPEFSLENGGKNIGEAGAGIMIKNLPDYDRKIFFTHHFFRYFFRYYAVRVLKKS
jgi:hypothetical protein